MARKARIERLEFPPGRRVLAISDIHGNLPLFRGVLDKAGYGPDDILVLVGDLVEKGPDSLAVLRYVMDLAARRTVYCVRGNCDAYWFNDLPDTLRVEIEGVRFFLIHDKSRLPCRPANTDVVLFGHTHAPCAESRDGALWLNPGSCGPRRYGRPASFCCLEAEGGRYRLTWTELPD